MLILQIAALVYLIGFGVTGVFITAEILLSKEGDEAVMLAALVVVVFSVLWPLFWIMKISDWTTPHEG